MSETANAARTDLLTLVRVQICTALSQINDAAAAHAAAPNNAALTPYVNTAHQIAGALRMVQLPGAARFAAEIETALKTALRGAPADVNEVASAARAALTLREFVDDVADGALCTARLVPGASRTRAGERQRHAHGKGLVFPAGARRCAVAPQGARHYPGGAARAGEGFPLAFSARAARLAQGRHQTRRPQVDARRARSNASNRRATSGAARPVVGRDAVDG
ncbi:MAG: hypothetical protein FJY56_14820 [Betaproteobacteria bacterium]|nr:hypothetical protein [Betaproteobacteria bacterium]